MCIRDRGNVLQIVKDSTEIGKGTEHVIAKIISLIESIDGYDDCVGIGMGVPGPVDTVNGKMVLATNLPGDVYKRQVIRKMMGNYVR